MKNFLKTYGYLIYFGCSIWILTPYNVMSFRWWIMLIIMFLLVEKMAVPKHIFKNIYKQLIWHYAWAHVLGIFSSLYFPITNIKFYIIVVPTVYLTIYRFYFEQTLIERKIWTNKYENN